MCIACDGALSGRGDYWMGFRPVAVKGQRLETVAEFYETSEPGVYCKVQMATGGTVWYIRDPNGRVGRLEDHTVVEHGDGTITVSPSILDASLGGWHGFLERGEWRPA